MNRYTLIIAGLLVLILGRFAGFMSSHPLPQREMDPVYSKVGHNANSVAEKPRKPKEGKILDSEWYLDPDRQKTDARYAERVYRFLEKQESTILLEMYGNKDLKGELEAILILLREYFDEDQARAELRDIFEDLGRIDDLRNAQVDALKYRDERNQLYGKSDSNELIYQAEFELNQSKIQKMSAALRTRLQVEFPQLDEAFFDRLFALSAKSNIPVFQIQSGIQPGQPLFERNGRWVLWDDE
jgi:hypothetical protein